MTRLLAPLRAEDGWRALLADPARHWRAGFSAMAAARSWIAAASLPSGLPPEFGPVLGPGAELLLAIPEHKVALPGGRRESQCDVFALVRAGEGLVAMAVEAKVEESFGERVGDWLRDASEGRRLRLRAIREALGCEAPPSALRYQLLHRTAAAVLEARRFGAGTAAMVVQSFSPARRGWEDFAAFCAHLGVEARPGAALGRRLPDGRRLVLGWVPGEARFLAPGDGGA